LLDILPTQSFRNITKERGGGGDGGERHGGRSGGGGEREEEEDAISKYDEGLNSDKSSTKNTKNKMTSIHTSFSMLQSPEGSVSDNEDEQEDICPETIRKFAIALAKGGGMRLKD
jgi:hypothetical protein